MRFWLYRCGWIIYMKAGNLYTKNQHIPRPICSCRCDWRRDHSSQSSWEGPMSAVSDCTSLGSSLTLINWASCVHNINNHKENTSDKLTREIDWSSLNLALGTMSILGDLFLFDAHVRYEKSQCHVELYIEIAENAPPWRPLLLNRA